MEHSYIPQAGQRRFDDLYLCYCGYEECRPGHSFGPAVRPNYIIHYILKGKGIYQTEKAAYELGAGQGFLIEPGSQTYYQADRDDPWTYLWVGFAGSRAAEYLSGMGLGEGRLTYHSSRGEDLKAIVGDMLKHNTYTSASQFALESALFSFFAALSEDLDVMSAAGKADGSLYVRKAVEFIQNNYYTPIRVTDIAGYVCINRSYLCTLFRKELNMSPQEYLANYRLTQAAELLLITDLSIEAVALSCGYSDPLVFSKAFKLKNGLTPSAYRREKLSRPSGRGRRNSGASASGSSI